MRKRTILKRLLNTNCIYFTLLATVLLFPHPVIAKEMLEKFDFSVSAGYRVDDLDWNHTADSTGVPNVGSELTWSDLGIYQVSNDMKLDWYDTSLPIGLALRSHLNYGTIVSGDNQDSDYSGNNRTGEYSRSNNNSDDGDVWDASFAVGLTFLRNSKIFRLTPLIGYSYHEQNLKMTDGYQTINTINPLEIGPFEQAFGPTYILDSTYDATWKGLYGGVEVEFLLGERLTVTSTAEYHDADYYAEADWNLRNDLSHPVSKTHESDEGSGVVLKGGILFALNETYLLNLKFDYQKWKAEDGVHTDYNSSGTTQNVKLNEVNWESNSISFGLTIRYH